MSDNVMRLRFDYRSPGMYPTEDGDYVPYTDFSCVEAERDRLRAELAKLRCCVESSGHMASTGAYGSISEAFIALLEISELCAEAIKPKDP